MINMEASEYFTDNKLIPFHTDSFHYKEIYKIMDNYANEKNKQLLDEIDMLKFQLKAADSVNENLSKQVEWISVEDRLPEFNKNVLVLDSTGRIDISFVDKTGTFDEFILEATHREDESVIFTHWMPLPNQPK